MVRQVGSFIICCSGFGCFIYFVFLLFSLLGRFFFGVKLPEDYARYVARKG
jgi:hypothetical protein